jgi:hypothetical protein
LVAILDGSIEPNEECVFEKKKPMTNKAEFLCNWNVVSEEKVP